LFVSGSIRAFFEGLNGFEAQNGKTVWNSVMRRPEAV